MRGAWFMAPAVTCAFALCLDHGAVAWRDLIGGVALGALVGGTRYMLVQLGIHPWLWR